MKAEIEELRPKEKADVLRALCEGAFKRRNELEGLEWKMNFSLWTGVVLAVWALYSNEVHLDCYSLLFFLVAGLHAYAVYMFNASEQKAVDFAMIYLGELEKLLGLEWSKPKSTVLWQWWVVEVGPTILLAAVAIRLTR